MRSHYITAGVATAGVLGGAYCAYRLYERTSKVKIPENWTQVGTLKDLYIYPIKSCGAVQVDKAECSLLGLKDGWLRDRFLMIVDNQNNFITARAYPELLLIQPSVKGSVLTLNRANMEPISVNLAEVVSLQKPQTATVWGVTVPVFDCGWSVSEWLSRLIDQSTTNFRLVYYAAQSSRDLRVKSINPIFKFGKDDTGALPDEVPFNLINEASVDDLNTRLEETQVSSRVFRPNFVLSGGKPYDEDNWKFVKIGDNVFEIIKPCTRCIMTTIDPETGIRYPKTEPLETLKTYRQLEDPAARKTAGSSPRMGLQMALRSEPGTLISLNDPIYVA
ncbi:mitochondrial amidoxime-reducing component 1 isoform X2 [Achroia grisella]|uniref:mitochondrial amidoxime-reducing component 1 isoform X2 n=1 Tax=Achroia grisella TaxID=688607 RepID=UPI0027D2E74F|nr:mitochondrial amidoxime-reducing component 1 isoform X2 [Achroia grisella]